MKLFHSIKNKIRNKDYHSKLLTDNLDLLKWNMLTQRQEEILKRLVEDYIKLARPISSEFFEKRHKLKISPPTIRLEFQKLTKKGFLEKPHISSGRIPTDKAYRYFVDNLLEEKIFEIEKLIDEKIEQELKLLQSLTRELAQISKSLIFGYLERERMIFKEGWEEVLKEPEFKNEDCVFKFLDFLEEFEREIDELKLNSEIKIYIGKENPFKKGKDFALIISKCKVLKTDGIFALCGPKRMDYNKNIGLMNSLKRYFEKICQKKI
jgi:heat-inducible transcriptional repressor